MVIRIVRFHSFAKTIRGFRLSFNCLIIEFECFSKFVLKRERERQRVAKDHDDS